MTIHTRLEAIKSLCDKASAPPWEDHNWDVMEKPHVVVPKLWDGHSSCNGSFDLPCTPGNAAFIAASRSLVPALVAALSEALTALDKIGNTIDSAPTDVSGSGPCRIRLAESRNRRICEAKDALARIEKLLGEK